MHDFAQNFDLTNGFNILRNICGLPHFVMKAKDIEGTVEVYRMWRLNPPRVWTIAWLRRVG